VEEFYHHASSVSAGIYQEPFWDLGLPGSGDFLARRTAAGERDEGRGYLVFHGSRPTGYLYCPVVGKTLVYNHQGLDLEYSGWSVGTLLLWNSLEIMFDGRRLAYLDFTEGDRAQNRMFDTHQVPCHNRLVVRRTVHDAVLLHTHRRFKALSEVTGASLDRLGLKASVKHLSADMNLPTDLGRRMTWSRRRVLRARRPTVGPGAMVVVR